MDLRDVSTTPVDSPKSKLSAIELTYLAQQWQPTEDPPLYSFWMASSDVDQKFLGHFAKAISSENSYLSSFLFRVLGLSVTLSEKLIRARKARRLDPVRDLKARHLIHHILWLSREGLVMVEQYILPMVVNQTELKVLSHKLRASFYHIFVLFHNDPPVNSRMARSRSGSVSSASVPATYTLFPDPLAPRGSKSHSQSSREPIRSPSTRKRSPAVSLGGTLGKDARTTTNAPPGLDVPTPFSTNPYSTIQPSLMGGSLKPNDPSLATYLLPLADYTPHATAAFKSAAALADSLLPGSHPVRLSVKVEYVAYVYDCLKEFDRSRKMAKLAIRSVYDSDAGMDDESFEDAAELVGLLGRMMKRGLGGGGSSSLGGGSGSQLILNTTSNGAGSTRGPINTSTITTGTSRNDNTRHGSNEMEHVRIRSSSSDILGYGLETTTTANTSTTNYQDESIGRKPAQQATTNTTTTTTWV